MPTGIVISAVIVGLFATLMIFVRNYMKAEPNEALIFTGRKYKTQIMDPDGTTRSIVRGWRAVVGGASRTRWPFVVRRERYPLVSSRPQEGGH